MGYIYPSLPPITVDIWEKTLYSKVINIGIVLIIISYYD